MALKVGAKFGRALEMSTLILLKQAYWLGKTPQYIA